MQLFTFSYLFSKIVVYGLQLWNGNIQYSTRFPVFSIQTFLPAISHVSLGTILQDNYSAFNLVWQKPKKKLADTKMKGEREKGGEENDYSTRYRETEKKGPPPLQREISPRDKAISDARGLAKKKSKLRGGGFRKKNVAAF